MEIPIKERQQADGTVYPATAMSRGARGRDKSVHPEEERRVPQLDRDQQPLVEGDEHRILGQHREASGEGIILYVLYRFIVS